MSACIHGARTSWTARTTTVIDVVKPVSVGSAFRRTIFVVVFCAAVGTAAAQDPRSHTRLNPRGTRVTESQAETLTLTLGKAEVRLLQTWVRTAGTIDKTGKVLSANVSGPEAALVKVGQRVRAFPPSSKSSMYQA
jgi:hypothetical protein